MSDILLLILFQAIWASSYVAMKLALADMPLGLVAILRYGIAALVLLLAAGWRGWKMRPKDLALLVGVGILDFTLSPYLQLKSLQLTYATDTAVLVAFEPIVTALLAVIVLREHVSRKTLMAFFMATVGVIVMSDVKLKGGDLDISRRLIGNSFFFLSLMCEAMYSIMSRYTTRRVTPLKVITLMTLAGAITNCGVHYDTITLHNFAHISASGWGAIAFLALGCSVLGYGGWTFLSKRIPVNRMTLSMFIQPIIGGVVANIMLGERPSPRTLIGAAIILASLLFWVLDFFRKRSQKLRATAA